MTSTSQVAGLPAFAALGAFAVLADAKRGASVQITSRYFDNRISVLAALDEDAFDDRIAELRESRSVLGDATVSVDSIAVEPLERACDDLTETFLDMPEVSRLRAAFSGDCVVVPELLRTPERIRFGTRAYFFREGEAPTPEEITRRNVEAVVDGERSEFERYKGRLHGYPDCCIEHFFERDSESSPEVRSVRPLESVVRDDLIGTGPSVSIGDVVPDLLEKEYAYAFFSRKFFPHPGCDVARDRGERIYETLVDEFGRTLARDYFRLDYVLAYFVARTTSRGTRELPVAGAFGREHLYSYLPLRAALATSRYS